MERRNLIFIGPINKGNVACTGDTVKNQLFLKRFSEIFSKVIVVDTYNWKKRPWCMLRLLLFVFFYRNTKVVVSANPGSADMVIRVLNKLNVSQRVFYWVVGGSLHKSLENGSRNWHNYSKLAGIFVQGTSMEMSMKNIGLTNVTFVPNSKYIDYIPEKKVKSDEKTHFVFLSRVEKYKGCDDIFDAIEILHQKGYAEKFDVTFYGKTTDESGYFENFKNYVKKYDNVEFKGVLNLKNTKNYDELAKYDLMLFPTFWPGEGFPGVIIDAYIAGLPVIASDWNLNTDVVKDNKTGWIITTHDVNELAEKMIYAIKHPEVVKQLSDNSRRLAEKYDSRKILSEDNLRKLAVL